MAEVDDQILVIHKPRYTSQVYVRTFERLVFKELRIKETSSYYLEKLWYKF